MSSSTGLITYDPMDWYWVVAGTTNPWASARVQYVAPTDPTYLAWQAGPPPRAASNIDSAASLGDVLNTQWAPQALATLTIQSTGSPALNGTYAMDQGTQAQITGIAAGIAAGRGLPGGGSTFNWPDVFGQPHAFSSTNFLNFASAAESYIYNFTQQLNLLVNNLPATLPTQPITIA